MVNFVEYDDYGFVFVRLIVIRVGSRCARAYLSRSSENPINIFKGSNVCERGHRIAFELRSVSFRKIVSNTPRNRVSNRFARYKCNP